MYKIITRGSITYFVSTEGSAAIVNNILYVNGKRAETGTYTFPTEAGDKVVVVDATGAVISYG